MFCLHVCKAYSLGAHRGQKRVLGALEQEVRTAVNCHLGCFSGKAARVLNLWAISPDPAIDGFSYSSHVTKKTAKKWDSKGRRHGGVHLQPCSAAYCELVRFVSSVLIGNICQNCSLYPSRIYPRMQRCIHTWQSSGQCTELTGWRGNIISIDAENYLVRFHTLYDKTLNN